MSLDPKNGFIYILREIKYEDNNDNIYRIGKISNDFTNILKKNNFDYKIYKYWKCKNLKNIDTIIHSIFNMRFIKKNKIGRKYYEGDIDEMILTIELIFNKFNNEFNIET
jgi:hypothetical protein